MALRPTALLFGDSITQYGFSPNGWASALAHSFTRKVDVINRGFSGYNSRVAKEYLDLIFPERSHHLFATVFFGANDAAQDTDQTVTLDKYVECMDEILSRVKRHSKHVVVVAPPPVDNERWPDRHNDNTKKYADAAVELAERHGVFCVNLYENMMASPDWRIYLNDGLHLSDEGNTMLAEELLRALPQPDDLPFDIPLFREVLVPNPKDCLTKDFVASLPYKCRHHTE